MGRPKKGELTRSSNSKPVLKKPTFQFGMTPDDGTVSLAPPSSFSDDQDDVPDSSVSFDPRISQPTNSQHDISDQQKQHQEQRGVSLGTLLHDCITVQDWTPGASDITEAQLANARQRIIGQSGQRIIGQSGQRIIGQSGIKMITSSGGVVQYSRHSDDFKPNISISNSTVYASSSMRSPSIKSDHQDLKLESIQFIDESNEQGNNLDMDQNKLKAESGLHFAPNSNFQQQPYPTRLHHNVANLSNFNENTSSDGPPVQEIQTSLEQQKLKIMTSMTGLDYVNDQSLTMNPDVKVEQIEINDGTPEQLPESYHGTGPVLENLKNIETLRKASFDSYNSSGNDGVIFEMTNENDNLTRRNSTSVEFVSQTGPQITQVESLNMNTQNTVYTPVSHDRIIIQNGVPHFIRNHSDSEQVITPQTNSNNGHVEQGNLSGNNNLVRTVSIDHQSRSESTPVNSIPLDSKHPSQEIPQNSRSQSRVSNSPAPSVLFSLMNNPSKLEEKLKLQNQQFQLQFQLQQQQKQQQEQQQRLNDTLNYTVEMIDSSSSQSPRVAPLPAPSALTSSHITPHSAVTVNSSPIQHLSSPVPSDFQTTVRHSSGASTPNPNPSTPAPNPISIPISLSSILALLQQQKDNNNLTGAQLTPSQIEHIIRSANRQVKPDRPPQSETIKEEVIVDLRRQQKVLHVDTGATELQPRCDSSSHITLDPPLHQTVADQQSPPTHLHNTLSTIHVHPDMNSTHLTDRDNVDYTNQLNVHTNMTSNTLRHEPSPTSCEPQQPAISSPTVTSALYSSPNEQTEDSKVGLIGDSSLLHEINRVFLGIDNSCEAYGCSRGESLPIEDQDVLLSVSPDHFLPEISHRYWHGFQPSPGLIPMTSIRQKIITEVLEAFDNLKRTYVTNEPEYAQVRID